MSYLILYLFLYFWTRIAAISREGNQRSGREAFRKYETSPGHSRAVAEKMCWTEATFHEHGRCYAKRHW